MSIRPLITVGLFVPIVAGLFVPRLQTAGALASSVAGLGAVLATQVLGSPGPPWMTPAVWGLMGAIAAALISLIVPTGPRD